MDKAPSYKKRRRAKHTGLDRELYLDIGCFVAWFCAVDHFVATLLAGLTNTRDLLAFDTLVKGMDLRTKLDRFRHLARRRHTIGPMLNDRLTYLEEKILRTRNNIAHSGLMISEASDPLTYLYFSQANMPFEQIGNTSLKQGETRTITSRELFEHAEWLTAFHQDLRTILKQTARAGMLELVNPLTPEHKRKNSDQTHQEHLSKSGTPSRKHQGQKK